MQVLIPSSSYATAQKILQGLQAARKAKLEQLARVSVGLLDLKKLKD
jgi:hypothetical protein